MRSLRSLREGREGYAMLVFSLFFALFIVSNALAGSCELPFKGYEYPASYRDLFSREQVEAVKAAVEKCNIKTKNRIRKLKGELERLAFLEKQLDAKPFADLKKRLSQLYSLRRDLKLKIDNELTNFYVDGLFAVVIDSDEPLQTSPGKIAVPFLTGVAVEGARARLRKLLPGYPLPSGGSVTIERSLYGISEFYGGGSQFVGVYLVRIYPCRKLGSVRKAEGVRVDVFDLMNPGVFGKVRRRLEEIFPPEVAGTVLDSLQGLSVMWRDDLKQSRRDAFRRLASGLQPLVDKYGKVLGEIKRLEDRLAAARDRLKSIYTKIHYSCLRGDAPEQCLAGARRELSRRTGALRRRLDVERSSLFYYGEGRDVGEVVGRLKRQGLAIGKIWVYPFRNTGGSGIRVFVLCSAGGD